MGPKGWLLNRLARTVGDLLRSAGKAAPRAGRVAVLRSS